MPTLAAPKSIVMKDRVAAVQLQRYWAVPGLLSPELATLDLGGSILGGLASSRLDRILVRDEKLAVAHEWGADVVVDHRDGDVVAVVKDATGKGVDVVVETVGEATWARSLAAVRPMGRVVVCGATSGPNPPAQLHRFWWKQLTVYGSTMGTREDFLGAYGLVRSGRARVHVDSTFPLSEIRAAHERLEAGEQLGKIVLTIP